MWSPENDMKENKMGNTWHAFVKPLLYILLKSNAQNYHSTSWRKTMGDLWGLPYNFTYVTTKLGNLYWKALLEKTCSNYYNIVQSVLEILSINKDVNGMPGIEVFFGSNLEFTIIAFIWV